MRRLLTAERAAAASGTPVVLPNAFDTETVAIIGDVVVRCWPRWPGGPWFTIQHPGCSARFLALIDRWDAVDGALQHGEKCTQGLWPYRPGQQVWAAYEGEGALARRSRVKVTRVTKMLGGLWTVEIADAPGRGGPVVFWVDRDGTHTCTRGGGVLALDGGPWIHN